MCKRLHNLVFILLDALKPLSQGTEVTRIIEIIVINLDISGHIGQNERLYHLLDGLILVSAESKSSFVSSFVDSRCTSFFKEIEQRLASRRHHYMYMLKLRNAHA